ncbi:flavodoxin family protein [Rhodovibrio salinarum]|uniref:Flavodoxin family protein n=1 Tax=Rhodovibrio salinarum TaxID=1087 RepID=A0A934V0S6_9PROT|nr:NAD(P)H-dependent oxidoreductase [Rhodovibrio salinarum]MBK1697961.1 flavodoxin family protein [Rhodovibrio salinarum]
MSARKHLLVVAHAPSPNLARLRDAALEGARDAEIKTVETRWKPPLEAGPDDVMAADALLLGTPENLGYMSGALKDFFDRTYYAVIEEKQGLPFAAYIRAGRDGTGTKRAIDSITTGLSWRPIQEPLILQGTFQENFVDQVRDLAQAMAAGLDAGIF